MKKLLIAASFMFSIGYVQAQTYDYVGPNIDGHKLLVKNGKEGLADSTGKEIVPPTNDHVKWDKTFIRIYNNSSVHEINIGGANSDNFGKNRSIVKTKDNGFVPPKTRTSKADARSSVSELGELQQKSPVDLKDAPGKVKSQTVIGADDRTTIKQGEYPYKAVGKIYSVINEKLWVCTGSLIDKDIVVTNAHCLYDADGFKFSNIYFFPDYNGKSPDPKIYSTAYEYLVGSINYLQERNKDYALLRLNSSLGTNYGWLGYKENFDFAGKQVSLSGYPTDFQEGELIAIDKSCEIKQKAAWGQYLHDCDSYGGASGSPIFYQEADGSSRVVAIHNTGHTYGSGVEYSAETSNGAVPIDNILPDFQKMENEKVSKNITVHSRNFSKEDIFVAYYYKNNAGNYTAEGWFKIGAGVSVESVLNTKNPSDVYVYAVSNTLVWSNAETGQSFCVDEANAFKYNFPSKTNATCPSGYKSIKSATNLVAGTDGVNYFNFY